MTSCHDFLAQGCQELGLALTSSQLTDLCRYYQELDKWSKKMNLVAKGPMAEILTSHFLDSLTLLPHLPKGDFSFMDVGTGAGFPGLILKVVCPEMRLTLVEPRTKRVTFLRHIIRSLQLGGEVVAERLKENDSGQIGQIGTQDIIASRAFADIKTFISLAEPFAKIGGHIICMKGPKADEELALWQAEKKLTRLEYVKKVIYPLGETGKIRQLLFFEKKEMCNP